MKLRNKFQDKDFELGEVADVDIATMPDGRIKAQTIAKHGGLHTFFYQTKAEFDADWEDVPEEPKEYWYIDTCEGWEICKTKEGFGLTDKENKEIGNYFETKEEAELAVRKLKAWKRLKDEGFRFSGWRGPNGAKLVFPDGNHKSSICDDLDLLFCTEENS